MLNVRFNKHECLEAFKMILEHLESFKSLLKYNLN